MFPAAGGVLLRTAADGVIGAVGVSGASSDIDEACAIAAAHELGLEPEPLRSSA
jgi:uncharacterized protein GlcG (DUF336 family)